MPTWLPPPLLACEVFSLRSLFLAWRLRLSVCLSGFLFVSICLSVCHPVCLSSWLSVVLVVCLCLPSCLPVILSVCHLVCLSFCLSILVFACLSIFFSCLFCPFVCLAGCLSVFVINFVCLLLLIFSLFLKIDFLECLLGFPSLHSTMARAGVGNVRGLCARVLCDQRGENSITALGCLRHFSLGRRSQSASESSRRRRRWRRLQQCQCQS